MQGERGIFAPKEAIEIRETGIRVVPPITPNELFGRTLRDGRNLALTTSPLHMFEVARENSQPEQIVVLPPLYGQQFWHFINTIAPLPYKMNIDGIISDWHMPDREDQSGRLAKHQRSMGEDWDLFEETRQIFIDTLALEPTWQRRSTWRFVHTFLGMDYEMEGRFAREIIAGLEANENVQEAFSMFLGSYARFKNRKWLKEGLGDGAHTRISQWGEWELKALARNFLVASLKGSYEEVKAWTVEHYNALDIGRSLDLVDGKVVLKVGTLLEGELDFLSDRRGNTGWMLGPETVASTNFVLPTIRWRRNELGEIVLSFDFLEKPIVEKILPHVVSLSSDLQFDTRRLNPVAGFGSIPYFIPELQKDWPQYQRIIVDNEKGSYQVVPASEDEYGMPGVQFMSAQAALVMALQHKDEISQNVEFFDRAEEHLRRYVA